MSDLSIEGYRIALTAAIVAFQTVARASVLEHRVDVDLERRRRWLEALIKHTLREVKDAPAEGYAEVDEIAGKDAVVRLVQQIAGALRKELG